ncbi:MAG: hypothetical protein HC822_12725 [Oscillochloris sp.]|nr:hypothetical protein [Oscillochloris sp.]
MLPANFQLIKDTVAGAEQRAAQKRAEDTEAWRKVYTILELAEDRKRGRQEPRAEAEQWQNVYAAPDATLVQAQPGQAAEVTPRWHTFGAAPTTEDPVVTPAVRGLTIASPLLALAEGNRTITLRVLFRPEHFAEVAIKAALEHGPFRVLLSAGGELQEARQAQPEDEEPAPISLESVSVGRGEDQIGILTFVLKLSSQASPIEPLPAGAGISSPWPLLQLLLADRQAANDQIYRALLPLRLQQIELEVQVSGISGLSLQNDDGALNPKKPFEPFGFTPAAGSSLYIAHPELCAKKLDSFDLQITWLGAPASFKEYYRGYSGYASPESENTKIASPISANSAFQAQLRLHDQRAPFDIAPLQLFAEPDAAVARTITISGSAITAKYKGYRTLRHLNTSDELLEWSRFWQLELLAPDFLHRVYPQAATGYANRRINKEPAPYIVNQPYTPKIKSITAGYVARETIDPAAGAGPSGGSLRHLEPFGHLAPAPADDGLYPFLPQYTNEGELYIGIADLAPPQNLTLLFQLAEGSADPGLAHTPPDWYYLDGNHWQSLARGRILADSSNGLLNSGIITIDLPPVAPSTRLPAGLYWIKAAVARNSRSIADTVAIEAQAVRATFVDRNNLLDHLRQALAPGSISGLAEPQAQIRALHQPYSSSGGKGPEDAARFYTRISERLRHKDRALTGWDYERMVLEAFPEIYKVKCLPAGTSGDPRQADAIQVIVIPDIRGKLPFDPFEPKVAADTLARITDHLAARTPAAAQFRVSNPAYIRLQVRLGVRLRPGYNPGFHLQLLNQELQRYLAPWAYDRGAEIVFGGRVNANLIVNFVEERPYIDYVAGIKLFIRAGDDSHAIVEVKAPYSISSDAILVSDRRHVIDLIGEERYQEQYFTGINYMQIELDFQVGSS